MSKAYQRQAEARKDLEEVWKHPEQVNVIHYSCESFYDRPDGSSPRITSIAIRNLKSGQTLSFSIHKFGELNGHPIGELDNHYNDLEKEMLDHFFKLAQERKDYKWLHWNMRDENYGFHALELRYKVLKGEPHPIPDGNKFDLSRILIGIYGKTYMGHPRLENLMIENNITSLGFKTGRDEAELFAQKNYVGLHQSTLAKVDILANVCQLEVHYVSILRELGKGTGMLGQIFTKAQNKIQDPAKLFRLIDMVDDTEWVTMGADVKGDIYEGLLERNAEDTKSGAGQYFTPRALIRAMVECIAA